MAIVLGDDLFADCQTEASSLLIHILILLFKLAKPLEKFADVVWVDSLASVADVHSQHLFDWVVRHQHLNKAVDRELEGIFDQVNQDLLESDQVPEENGQFVRLLVLLRVRIINDL